ncbi:hypothetical protein ACIP17_12090 [Streptomyces iakyrus]|uniref:hypothetical protein n=1 Tax=Streptomyces iakyrus TaxID=68219 RepID=UPI00380BC7E3
MGSRFPQCSLGAASTTRPATVVPAAGVDADVFEQAADASDAVGQGGAAFGRRRGLTDPTLLDAREPIVAVSNWLGHADASITLKIYAHMMPEADGRGRAAMDALFEADS